MIRLALVIFAMVATSLMGSFVVLFLALGYDTSKPIILAAVIGFILAIPVSKIIAKKMSNLTNGSGTSAH